MLKNWLLAFRPKTLTAALVPIWVASAYVYQFQSELNYLISLYALLSALCIQIGTNLVNDAIDYKKGTDNHDRLGPRRVTQEGIFSYSKVMSGAAVFFMLAILFGLPLVLEGGWVILAIGIVSILLGYAYTMGPLPLAYVGLGDLFVILFFGLVAVGGIGFLHLKIWNLDLVVLGLQVGLWATVLIAINNLRDIDNDQKSNKKTLAVRMGVRATRWMISFYTISPFFLGIYWFLVKKTYVAVLPVLFLPLAIQILKSIWQTNPSKAYNKYLAQSAGLHLAGGILLGLGFLI